MTAGKETRDSRRVFEDQAPFMRLGIDHLRNTPLRDHGRRVCPCHRIGKEHLHITRTHRLTINLILRSMIAFDFTDDLNFITIVIGGWGCAGRVIKKKRNFGNIALRTLCCTIKDHIFHAAAAHTLGRIFTHDPAQGFYKIGFTTAIRPDNTIQARRNF